MPAPQNVPTSPPALLKPAEVMRLLRIGRTTLHERRVRGELEAVRPSAGGWWLYPAAQPALQTALEAAGGLQ